MKKLSMCIFFVISLVVMITPAFAVEMEEVAHDAQKYNEESKEKQTFFGKIKVIAKGFKLVSKAKKAEKESEKKKKEIGTELKETDGELIEKHKQLILTLCKLRKYRNSKNVANQTNTTSSNSTVSTPVVPVVPEACINHIDSIVNFLNGQGLEATYLQNSPIDSTLVGKIAQIITPNGNIRYIEIISINNNTVTVNTGTGNKEYTLDEFTKSFTGITLQTKIDTNTILGKINNKEKIDLDQENTQAQTIHDKARNQIIIWGTLIGVAAILIIVGVVLTVYFASQLIQLARAGPEFAAKFTEGTPDLYIDEPSFTTGRLNHALERVTLAKHPPPTITHGLSETVSYVIADYLDTGITITELTALEIALNTAATNWIKVILCIIGLILILVGIGLIIAGIIKTVKNGMKLHMANVVIRRNQKDINDLKEWTSTNNTNVLQNTTNNSTGNPHIMNDCLFATVG